MKSLNLILISLALISLGACNKNEQHQQAAAPAPEMQAQPEAMEPQTNISGTVTETMDTAGYTYIKVDTGSEQVWVASPEFTVKIGDPVIVGQSLPMPNYHSNTLNRDFELVYFASNVAAAGQDIQLNENSPHASPHAGVNGEHSKPKPVQADIDMSSLTPLEGGKTIAQVYAEQDQLAGQEISIRAKVVKFSPNIMKTNWIHIQDGSEGNKDLTITSLISAGIDDTVVVKGILEQNQDFGYGYKYDLIIQNAEVTIEE